MKADLVLVISPEAPLMKQLGKVLGKLCTPYDFSTIERGEKYITIQHDETGINIRIGDCHQKHEDVIKRKPGKITEFLNGLAELIRKEHEKKGYR